MSRIAPPSWQLREWFHRYLRWYVPRHFHGVKVANLARFVRQPDAPTIVYLNHPGWWDPLLCMLLERHAWGNRVLSYAPIDAAALEQYKFFRRLGLFPVEMDSTAGARRFLCDARGLLAQPGAVLWITPQGRFRDARARPLDFRAGLGALVSRLPRCRVLPVAIEYVHWDERLPEALLHCGELTDIEDAGKRSAAAWTKVLEQNLEAAQDELATLAIARNPAPFAEILRGNAGIGPAYDASRRARAAFAGERFQREHGAIRPRREP